MKIYITIADGEENMIPCMEAHAAIEGRPNVLFVQAREYGSHRFHVGEDCELTEARARKVVRERTGAERDRLLVRVTELDAALDDETWPPVVRTSTE